MQFALKVALLECSFVKHSQEIGVNLDKCFVNLKDWESENMWDPSFILTQYN
jgi:hypothetical protein